MMGEFYQNLKNNNSKKYYPWSLILISTIIFSFVLIYGSILISNRTTSLQIKDWLLVSFGFLGAVISFFWVILSIFRSVQSVNRELSEIIKDKQQEADKMRNDIEQFGRRILMLETINKIGSAIIQAKELKEVADIVSIIGKTELNFDRVLLFLIDENDKTISPIPIEKNYSSHEWNLEIDKISDKLKSALLLGKPSIIENENDELSKLLNCNSYLVVPIVVENKTTGIIIADNYKTNHPIKEQSIEILSSFSSFIASATQNIRRYNSLAERERADEEIRIAQYIQKRLMPECVPNIKGLDVARKMLTTSKAGGDYFDFIVRTDDITDIIIGDVSGKGVGAGLIMAMLKSVSYFLPWNKVSIKDTFVYSNKLLFREDGENRFITATYIRWNNSTNEIQYCNAGHEHIVYYNSAEKKSKLLKQEGVALGLIKDIQDQLIEESITLKNGDIIVLFTDGITESIGDNDELFGERRILNVVDKCANFSSEQILDALISSALTFAGNRPQNDDITVIVLKKVELSDKQ